MESYTKQSYEPDDLFLSNSGKLGIDDEPFSLVGDDLIKMNLLILAYEKPVTLSELSKAIGISTAYIEPIIDKLVEGQLMKKYSDKVYTDFIIFSENDRRTNLDIELKLANELCEEIWDIVSSGLDELRQSNYYKAQTTEQAIKLESFFALRTILLATCDIRDSVAGGRDPYEQYPERPNGGKWYAMGNLYPHGYDHAHCPYNRYQISGEAVHTQNHVFDAKELSMCSYNTDSSILGTNYKDISNPSYLRLLYSIYLGKTDVLEMFDRKLLEGIDEVLDLNLMIRDEEGRLKINIPVITMENRWTLYLLCDKYKNELVDKYRDKIADIVKNPVIIPKHLKSVPNWLRYLECCSHFPSAVLLETKDRGLFLKGYNRPAPAVILCVEK